MSPHRPKGRTIWRVKVPTRYGWVDRSTGSRDKNTAKAMDRMLEDLGPRGKRSWDLLDRIADSTLTLGRLYDAWRIDALDLLRAELDDKDLRPLLKQWQDWLAGRTKPENAARYLAHVEMFMGKEGEYPRSKLTGPAVDQWLSHVRAAPATKRRYFAALKSLVSYLRMIQVLDRSPLDLIRPPRAPLPAPEFLTYDEVVRLVRAAEEPYQTLFAFLYGTGCDLTPALGVHRRDVQMETKEVRAKGTKSSRRDRIVMVSEWAWPWVLALASNMLPDSPLFPGITRHQASKVHRRLVGALGLNRKGIRLHAARHYWATQMLRAGAPVEMVARQLGNDAGTCLLYYGRFVPTREERQLWNARVEEMDKATNSRGGI
jgi:integrase